MANEPVFPGVDPRSPEHGARLLAKKLRDRIIFSTEKLGRASDAYVAWFDLIGAGNMMSYSPAKAANAIARIHLAVHIAKTDHKLTIATLAINDGLFLISQRKADLVAVLRTAILHLVGCFIARPNHPDRFLARAAIAYGPVYSGNELGKQLSATQISKNLHEVFSHVALGAPIIQAYQSERLAPAYGVAIHESARSFSPVDELPFRTPLWRWWQTDDGGGFAPKTPAPVIPLKEIFIKELLQYFNFLEATLPFHLIEEGKVTQWRKHAERYYLDYKE